MRKEFKRYQCTQVINLFVGSQCVEEDYAYYVSRSLWWFLDGVEKLNVADFVDSEDDLDYALGRLQERKFTNFDMLRLRRIAKQVFGKENVE